MREVATRGEDGWKARSKGISSWRASMAAAAAVAADRGGGGGGGGGRQRRRRRKILILLSQGRGGEVFSIHILIT
jgi:hypothetical protein